MYITFTDLSPGGVWGGILYLTYPFLYLKEAGFACRARGGLAGARVRAGWSRAGASGCCWALVPRWGTVGAWETGWIDLEWLAGYEPMRAEQQDLSGGNRLAEEEPHVNSQ